METAEILRVLCVLCVSPESGISVHQRVSAVRRIQNDE